MTRYRDKETGEVVDAWQSFGGIAYMGDDGIVRWATKQDFRARFEPVEDVTAQPGVR